MLALELPWCRDVAVNKKVHFKYKIGWDFINFGEARWVEYSRTRQVIAGGFDWSWEIRGDGRLYYYGRATFRNKVYEVKGDLAAIPYEHCDECDGGRRNNRLGLQGPTNEGRSFDTWPKNRDRKRIVIVEPGGT